MGCTFTGIMMAELLKNLYDKDYVQLLANNIESNYPNFSTKKFIKNFFTQEWKNLELKQRMRHIVHAVHNNLPFEYARNITILKNTFKMMNYDFNLQN